MYDNLAAALGEYARQFPVIVLALGLVWYFVRHISRQHERELAAKDREITRLLEEKQKEIDRLLEERRKYFQMFQKKLNSAGKKSGTSDGDPIPPASR